MFAAAFICKFVSLRLHGGSICIVLRTYAKRLL